jgi:hypothetical protein
MKTKAILATLLVAAAASADARFAWPYPRKAVSPDESGHWIVINGNPWSHDVESELTTASPSGGGPDGLKSSPSKEKCRTSRNGLPGAAPKNRGRDFTLCEMSIFECLRRIA